MSLPWPPEKTAAFRKAILSGATNREIGALFCLEQSTIRKRAKALGLKARRQNVRRFTECVNFRMSPQMFDALLTLSYNQRIPVTRLIRAVCQDYIDENMPLPSKQPRAQTPVPGPPRQGDLLQGAGDNPGSSP